MRGSVGRDSCRTDSTVCISLTLLLACAIYLYVATGTVYGAHGVLRVLKVSTLTLAMATIVLGYRFALLLVTLYST